MKWKLDHSLPDFKSGRSTSRVDLSLLAEQLAERHGLQLGLSFVAIAHDQGCPLEVRPDASFCTCRPNIDLQVFDGDGSSRWVRLMEDGKIL